MLMLSVTTPSGMRSEPFASALKGYVHAWQPTRPGTAITSSEVEKRMQ